MKKVPNIIIRKQRQKSHVSKKRIDMINKNFRPMCQLQIKKIITMTTTTSDSSKTIFILYKSAYFPFFLN